MFWRQVVSQSPIEPSDVERAREADSPFRVNLSRMNELIRNGGTFSGHERNCAYLNVGDGTFANISAVSGLDFLDDARTLGLVDWDHDGDLDVWTANRTAPQLRFLRNDAPPRDHHFLTFRLEGHRCNRDAIGARVEVHLKDSTTLKMVKSLRAGEGFLGQSAKCLHFGLGEHDQIDRVSVYWPGDRQPQEFSDVRPDRFYYLTQDEARPRMLSFSAPRVPNSTDVIRPPTPAVQRVLLTSRVLMPNLEYQTFDGKTKSLDPHLGSPLLVNLWAAWCAPCVAELSSLATNRSRVSDAGLRVVALSVDKVVTAGDAVNNAAAAPDARMVLNQTGFPFEAGVASAKVLKILQYLTDLRFSEHRTMPLPCSVLVDRQGRIAGIYRGAIDVDELLSDVTMLSSTDDEWRRRALPLAGRWHRFPNSPSPMIVPLHLLKEGHVTEALSCVDRFETLLENRKEYSRLLVWLGDELFLSGRPSDGLRQYERALRRDPNYVPAMNNLAWKCATYDDAKVRDAAKAVTWAEGAAAATQNKSAAVLDTLAAAYAEAGRWRDAQQTAHQALTLARAERDTALANSIQKNLREYEQSRPLRSPSHPAESNSP